MLRPLPAIPQQKNWKGKNKQQKKPLKIHFLFYLNVNLSGCGIITAWIPRVTTNYPLEAQPRASQASMPWNDFARVVRAGRSKTAGWGPQRAYQILVRIDHPKQQSFHLVCTFCSNCISAIRPSVALSESSLFFARITKSNAQPAEKFRLNISLINRLAKFLDTASGMILLLATTPRRDTPILFSLAWIANHLLAMLAAFSSRSKSVRFLIRRQRGKDCPALDCKTLAALCPAGVDYCSSALGLHADQKPVCAFALGNRRLICAFHGLYLLKIDLKTRDYNIYWLLCQVYFFTCG